MGVNKSIHDINDLFESDQPFEDSKDIYDLVLKYIIHPIFKHDFQDQINERKKYGISGILEYRIQVNDIRNYLNQASTRFRNVISVKMDYDNLKIIFARLTQVYTKSAIKYFDLPRVIENHVTYLDKYEQTKLKGYIRLL